MNVLHINTTSHFGGAARAMWRLHCALKENQHGSQLLVGRSRHPEDPEVHFTWDEVRQFRSIPKSIKSRIGNRLAKYIGVNPWENQTTLQIAETETYQWADIIDLRNLFGGFFNLWSLPAISAGKPVFWRLPDMWALTGHCAYPYDCERWKTGCYSCPLMTPAGRKRVQPRPPKIDNTKRIWKAKNALYAQSNLHVIVNSDWMRKQVEESILKNALSITVISNGVDLKVFKPLDRQNARKALGLPANEKIVLWAASGKGNYRKGYHLAVGALQQMQDAGQDPPLLVTMGGEGWWKQTDTLRRIHHLGYITEAEKQALIYSAADVFLCSTLADAQPQTALESIACGTPVIAFDIGPMAEIVINDFSGLLCAETTAEALREKIELFFNQAVKETPFRENCREQALKAYDIDRQTGRYIELYESQISA